MTGPPGARPAAAGGAADGRAAASRTVRIDGASLIGLPVAAVRQQLRQLGLQVRVHWRTPGEQVPGTVVATQPSGPLPAGSVVVLTATLWPAAPGGAASGWAAHPQPPGEQGRANGHHGKPGD